jgi:hypothetical protein
MLSSHIYPVILNSLLREIFQHIILYIFLASIMHAATYIVYPVLLSLVAIPDEGCELSGSSIL